MEQQEKEIEQAKTSHEKPKIHLYDKWYKLFAIIPLIIFIICLSFLGYKWLNGQELIKKDVSLTGGITLTINYEKEISLPNLEKELSDKFYGVTVRRLSELGTGKQSGIIIETSSEDIDAFTEEVESLMDIRLTNENSSMEFTGPALSQSFFKQLIKAFIFALIFIAAVVLILFRVFLPSFFAVFSIISDAVITLTILSVFDFRISTAGIAAFLMLIGYSIDTDILLTTRVLKRREKSFYTRIKEA
ncbi:MAG: hypothetical protein KJ767_01320, partial [Nanoarchaeota archaeon]|nr:hypothetical protein [Nanoarchaeota archaeon]